MEESSEELYIKHTYDGHTMEYIVKNGIVTRSYDGNGHDTDFKLLAIHDGLSAGYNTEKVVDELTGELQELKVIPDGRWIASYVIEHEYIE